MLVLSRQRDEAVRITCPDGTVVEVVVVDIRGDKVRLGFTAPRDYIVDREEVARAREAEAATPPLGPAVGADRDFDVPRSS